MEQLKHIKQSLINQASTSLNDVKHVNAKELGEVVDMIKDLEEAMYYCSIISAMEDSKKEHEMKYYSHDYMHSIPVTKEYTPYMEYAPYMLRDNEWRESRNYYEENADNGKNYYGDRSSASRRMYMETKQTSDDKKASKELDKYIKDLTDDIIEMIQDSSPEEKQVLSTKLTWLSNRISGK